MAKALKIVGTVVAVVGLVASAIATGGASIGIAASVVSAAKTVAAVAMIASAAIAVVSSIAFKPKFSSEGNPTKFTTNPQSGIPYCIGRTRQSGIRIHADTWNAAWSEEGKNDALGFGVLLSGGGQIDAIEKFTADGTEVTFDPLNGLANSSEYAEWMAQKVHLGGPQTSALSFLFGGTGFPSWTSAHKLSGMTHAIWGLRYDFEGKKFGAGVPEPAWIGRWVKVYDPRLDSTYPGGSGSCRPLQETTYIWSRNPALHALTWALGRWQNGKKVFGIGAPFDTIRVADFVEAANVADANDWYCGGVEYSTESKWTVLKRMLQAGGAVPTMTGAMIGCRVYTPRVSVTTIEASDLLDNLSLSATKPQRDRFNTIIPRYRSEAHEWEVISGTPISAAAYVAEDGRVRQKEYDLPLVQHEVGQAGVDGNKQAGQLAAYEIVESREAGPISFTTGPKFLGLKAGDCVNINAPSEGFDNTKIMIIEPPKFDPANGKISFLGQTETDLKHPYALGQITTPPPPFSLTPPDLTPPIPITDQWTVSALINADGIPILRIVGGTAGGAFWNGIVIQYKKTTDTEWTEHGVYRDSEALTVEILVEGDTEYQTRIAYLGTNNILSDWLYLTNVTTPAGTIAVKNAVVFLFRRTTTSTPPSVPSTTSTYNFSTGELLGFNNGWATSLPTTGGDYRWMTKATAIGTLETDTILSSEWSTPSLLSQDGADGTPGVNAVTGRLTNESHSLFAYANGNIVAYTGATGSFVITSGTTDVSSSFTLSIPAGGNPQGLTYTLSGMTYTVTGGFDANEDTATLTIRATGSGAYSTVVIDKVFSLAKTKGGYEIVTSLPTTNLFEGRMVFLTTDDKLYRYTGSAWTAAVPAVDISGQLADAQIASLAASKVTGQLSDSQLAAIAAAKVTGQIVGTQITDGAISTAKLAAGSVTSNEIAANTITAADIAAGTITATQIAAATITGAKIAAGTIQAGNIVSGTITANEIAANAITAVKLAANSVTTDKIEAGAITAAKVGTNEIVALSANIKDGVIQTAKIGDLQVSTLKIANFAVNAVSSVTTTSSITVPAGGNSGNILQIVFNKVGGTESNILIQLNAAPVGTDLNAFAQLRSNHAGTLAQAPAVAGNTASYAATIPMSLYYVDTGLPAGTYTYYVSFSNFFSTKSLLVTNYVPVTLTVQEVKK